MNEFFDYLYKYGLHDCMLDEIVFTNKKITFHFNSGVYELNPVGKETVLTKSCKMIVEFENVEREDIFSCIDICQITYGKIKDVSFKDFIKQVEKFKFSIDMQYYSHFCNSILLKGYIKNKKYEIIVFNIKKIHFIF